MIQVDLAKVQATNNQHKAVQMTLHAENDKLEKANKAYHTLKNRFEQGSTISNPATKEEVDNALEKVNLLKESVTNLSAKLATLNQAVDDIEKFQLEFKIISKGDKKGQAVVHFTDMFDIQRSKTVSIVRKDNKWMAFHPLTKREIALNVN